MRSSLFYLRLLKRLNILLLRLFFTSLKKRKIVLGATAFLIILSFIWASRAPIAVRTEDFSDPNLSSYQDMKWLKGEYAFEDKLSLIIKSDRSFTQADLCKIETWLMREMDSNPDVLSVTSLFELRDYQYNEGKLFYPKLLGNTCEDKSFDLEKLKKHPLLLMFSTPALNDLIIHFEIKPSDKKFAHGIYDYEKVFTVIKSAKDKLPYTILTGGTLFFQASILEGIYKSDLINLLAALILFAGHYFFYRSLIAAGGLIGIILITSTIIRAGMAVMGHMIDPLTSCIFVLIMVAILEDYILLSYTLFKRKLPYNVAVRSLLLPSFLTSLTTAIGFGSLAVSDNPSIVHFSIWTTAGSLMEWITLFLIVPALVNAFPKIKKRLENHPLPVKKVPEKLVSYTPGKWGTILISLVPVAIFFVHSQGNLDYNPMDILPSDHALSEYRNHVLKTRQTEGDVSIVFSEKKTDVKPYLEQFRKDPLISGTYSEQEVMDHFSTAPGFLRGLMLEDFNRGALGEFFTARDSKRIVTPIKSYNSKDIPGLQTRLASICKDKCEVISEAIVSNDYAMGILSTLYESFFSGFTFIIILVTWLVLAVKRRYLLPVMISTVWASLTLLLGVIIFQVKINVVTCVALSVLIGAAGDNAIQYLLLKRETLYHSVKELGEASSETFILMIGVSLTMYLSYFESARSLGLLLISGIILMFIGDLWVLSGLTTLMDDIFRKRTKVSDKSDTLKKP